MSYNIWNEDDVASSSASLPHGLDGASSITSDDLLEDPDAPPQGNKLSTFMGVFVPCTLSIFGVILFQRLAFIVGEAGIIQTMIMFALGYAVVTFTILSLSAIATNGKMESGGAYFLISRALGPEFGASIGIIFYAANVAGCAVYLLGFAEAAQSAFSSLPTSRLGTFALAGGALLVLAAVCYAGAELYAKTSLVVFVGMVISIGTAIVSFCFQKEDATEGYVGFQSQVFSDNVGSQYTGSYDFFSVFAILFPAVTGVMAGCNIAGDLKTPERSIPVGTLAAIGASSLIYTALVLIIAATCVADVLVTDAGYSMMHDVSYAPFVITLGIFLAVLSSAMGSIIGGAKILQALARDDLLPILGFFKKGSEATDEPRRGVIFTTLLVTLVLAATSNLNQMATFQTLFFLLSYAVVNFACFALSVQGSPNFRPTWKFYSWPHAAAGTLLNVAVMFLTDILYASISFVLCITLIFYVHYRAPVTSWGDVSQSIIYHQVRKYLLRLDERKMHVKFWRPQVLLMVANPRSAYRAIYLANKIKKGGLLLLGTVVHGDPNNLEADPVPRADTDNQRIDFGDPLCAELDQLRGGWLDYIQQLHLKAFPSVVAAPTVRSGLQSMLMATGLGAMRPNTVIFGHYDERSPPTASINHLPHLSNAGEESVLDALKPFPRLRGVDPMLPPDEYVSCLFDCLRFGNHVIVLRNARDIDHTLLDGSKASASARGPTSLLDDSPSVSLLDAEVGSINDHSAPASSPDKRKNIDVWIVPLATWYDAGDSSAPSPSSSPSPHLQTPHHSKAASSTASSILSTDLDDEDAPLGARSTKFPVGFDQVREARRRGQRLGAPSSHMSTVSSTSFFSGADDIAGMAGGVEDDLAGNLCLLLGWLLHRSHSDIDWRKATRIRVFSIVEHRHQAAEVEERLVRLVRQTRIACDDINVLSLDAEEGADGAASEYDFEPTSPLPSGRLPVRLRAMSSRKGAHSVAGHDMYEIYNRVMKRHSAQSALALIPLPRPPASPDTETARRYLADVETLSNGLCPVLNVHAVSEVISHDL